MPVYKKITAFVLSLAVCVSAYAFPVISSLADDVYIYEDETQPPTKSPEDEYIVSGEYSYSISEDGTICIEKCTSQDKEIVLPDTIDGYSVTEIGRHAFEENSAESIVIPSGVEYISAENPFVQCSSLKEIKIDGESDYYCSVDGVLYTKDMKKLFCFPQAKSGTSYEIPQGVEQIGIAAFYGTSLTDIKIPDSVSKIGRHSFASSAITSIDLSSTSIDIIDVMTFMNCSSLSEVILPDTVEAIGLSAFYGCKSLENIHLPESLIAVEQNAFMGTGLKKIIIPSSVMSIGYSAFGYDENENPIEDFRIVGESGSAAQAYAVDTDSEYDYANNFTFTTVEADESYEEYLNLDTKIYDDYEYFTENGEATIVFCYSSDSTVSVPEDIDGMKVTAIYKNAFMTCTSAEIILPDTVRTIGDSAFSSYVVKIVIPGGCMSIEGDEPFLMCSNLQEIEVTDGDGEYSSLDGVLYNKDKSRLIAYPLEKRDTDFKAPEALREIGVSAFCNNRYIENIDISNVTDIANFAFDNCPALKSVRLSKGLRVVGNDAFYGCSMLKSIRLYDKLETIGDYAFGYEYDDAAAEEAANASDEEIAAILNGQAEAPQLDKIVDGFRIYADENTLGYDYAQSCGIETITGTAQIGSKNVSKGFIYAVTGTAGVILLAVVGIVTGSNLRKGRKKKS
ncbi:MAG: leucine-rich repeat domain-containing protein [Ruminococcus sp.]|nr:leucine-rich repeat domain-containing protein [Ruminococcus sp.]